METHLMNEKIGGISLDYSFYTGEDNYTDGLIEDELLKACKNGTGDKLLHTSNNWAVLYHLSDIRENLLEWYPFTKKDTVLEIGSGCGAITGVLSRKARHVTCIELSKKRSLINAYRHKENENIEIFVGNFQDIEPHMEKFDYVTLIGVWEYSGLYIEGENPYLEMLSIAKSHLKPNGKLIIAIENKMGLKYWNGAVEDHTGGLYSGLNDYINDYNRKVRTFSKIEIEKLFKEADIDNYRFFYPMPDYKLPDVIYHDEALPAPGSERNFGKDYSSIRFYNFNDAVVSDQLCADGIFPYFANSFLIIAGGDDSNQTFAKYNRTRKKEFQIKTEIFKTENTLFVKKSGLSKEAQEHILHIKDNEGSWSKNPLNIKQAVGKIQDGEYFVPYIKGVNLDTIFYKYRNDIKKFIGEFLLYLKRYFNIENLELFPFSITDDFVKIFGKVFPYGKGCLNCTNVDMIFSNLILTPERELYCLDCEWVFDFPVPFEYVIWRMAAYLYEEYRAYLKDQMSLDRFLNEIGISKENMQIYINMDRNFSSYVHGEYKKYLANYRKNALISTTRFL